MAVGPVVMIVGPTASGKTAVGIEVAERAGGEIISVDSRQVYRYMDIGTAKPSVSEQERVTHHFVDLRDPDQAYSAGSFGREARDRISHLQKSGVLPILVGGSGLYLQAVIDGFFTDDCDYSAVRSELKARLASVGIEPLLDELRAIDPGAADRLRPTDVQRVVRALEMGRLGAGSQQARWRRDAEEALDCTPVGFCLFRQRELLNAGIDRRVHVMVEAGLVEEVAALRDRGYGNVPTMATFGYGEIGDYLDGNRSLSDAIELIQRRSRRYAKRQLTWFRHDRRMRWLDVDDVSPSGVVDRILRRLEVTHP